MNCSETKNHKITEEFIMKQNTTNNTENIQNWNPDEDYTNNNVAEQNTDINNQDMSGEIKDQHEQLEENDISFAEVTQNEESTTSKPISKCEIQCAACGNISGRNEWFLSRIGSHYLICPKCGTIRYVCSQNADYRK